MRRQKRLRYISLQNNVALDKRLSSVIIFNPSMTKPHSMIVRFFFIRRRSNFVFKWLSMQCRLLYFFIAHFEVMS